MKKIIFSFGAGLMALFCLGAVYQSFQPGGTSYWYPGANLTNIYTTNAPSWDGVPSQGSNLVNLTYVLGLPVTVHPYTLVGTNLTQYQVPVVGAQLTNLVDGPMFTDSEGTNIYNKGMFRAYALVATNSVRSSPLGYTLNGTTYGNQVFTGEATANSFAAIVGAGGASHAIKTDPNGRAYGRVGVVGSGYNSLGGGRNSMGFYGYDLIDTAGGNAYDSGFGGFFLAEMTATVTAFNSDLNGVYAKADASGATSFSGTPIAKGISGMAVGKTGITTYGGYFSGTGGTVNYGVYSAAGSNVFVGQVYVPAPTELTQAAQLNTVRFRPISAGGNVTLTSAHYHYDINVTSGMATLPDASTVTGKEYIIGMIAPATSGCLTNAGGQKITLPGGSFDAIVFNDTNSTVRIMSDGAVWRAN